MSKSDRKKRWPTPFDVSNVYDVMAESVGAETRTGLYTLVKKVIDESLRETLFAAPVLNLKRWELTKAEMPNVIVRVETLQLLLDSFREMLKDEYDWILRKGGDEIGVSFAGDLLDFLRKKNCIPSTYEALLSFWASYDSSSGWGKISIVAYKDDEIRIRIEKSFLTSGYDEEIHRHCSFFEGYIKGVVDKAFSEYLRWIEETGIYKPPSRPLKPINVREEPENSTCVFIVELGEEALTLPFDEINRAEEAYRRSQFDRSLHHARSALELALKDKIGIERETRVSFYRLLKTYIQMNLLPLSKEEYKSVESAYDLASRVIHGVRKPKKQETRQAIKAIRNFVNGLELTTVTDAQKMKATKRLQA